MKKIVITGPESSGKSTLTKALSEHFNSPKIDEYAVEYLLKNGAKYEFRDLLKIAKGQINSEDLITPDSNNKFLFCDTDLITIKIWSKVKYNKISRWIMKTIRNRQYDHYLLCKPDIPWEYNQFRENPNDRDLLFKLYEKELKKYNKSYTIIEGSIKNRLNSSIKVINGL